MTSHEHAPSPPVLLAGGLCRAMIVRMMTWPGVAEGDEADHWDEEPDPDEGDEPGSRGPGR